MQTFPIHAALLAGLLTFSGMAVADTTPADNQEQNLIAVLQGDAAPKDKAITCKKLAVSGTKAAVPALAALLADEKLASWARIALEAIPDPTADAALRAALDRLHAKPLIGVINSLGQRRDPLAVAWLTGKLRDADPELVSAAAAALGRIADPAAIQALEQALPAAPSPTLPAFCEALLRCADHAIGKGDHARAAAICERIRALQIPRHIRMEATRSLIVARHKDGIQILLEQLRGTDDGMIAVALGLANDLPGPELTQALIDELPKLPVEKQVNVIDALANRHDKSVLPCLLDLTTNTQSRLGLAAIAALTRIGDVSVLPKLQQIALAGDSETSKAAQAAIYAFPALNPEADKATSAAREALKDAKAHP